MARSPRSPRRRKETREPYDRVLIVTEGTKTEPSYFADLDRNGHTNFDAASRQAEAENLLLARSWPCFEFWLLLHFAFTRAPFGRTGGRSPCDNCIVALRKHFTDYRKATPGVFDRLASQLETAKAHAQRALDDAASDDEWNPSTEMHRLVEYLQMLKLQR